MGTASAAQLGDPGQHRRAPRDRQRSAAGRPGSGGRACRNRAAEAGTVPVVWSLPCRTEPLTGSAAVALIALTVTGCGSGDSTVAKTPQATTAETPSITAPAASGAPPGAAPPNGAPADPCAVNLASPTIAKVVSELPRDPRSQQPWNPEPLAGNYNQCAQLSAVIIKANTNALNPTTRAVLFHLGQFIPQGVPDTYGFNGIDAAQTTGDTVALTYPSAITNLSTNVKFHWNGNGVELIGNTPGH